MRLGEVDRVVGVVDGPGDVDGLVGAVEGATNLGELGSLGNREDGISSAVPLPIVAGRTVGVD